MAAQTPDSVSKIKVTDDERITAHFNLLQSRLLE
jgi:hypothetical protein